ncbi:MAG: CAP domain-containing protein [Gaiellaceae bacterium]
MRKILVALVLSATLLAAAEPASAARVTDKPSLEQAVVKRMNAVRRNHGLRKLRVVRGLSRAAERHAASMGARAYFRHELFTPRRSPRWTGFGGWIRWFYPGPGFRSWSAGENLAWGAPRINARQAVRRWMRSPGHRRNLLTRGWRHVGVGVVHVRNPAGYFRGFPEVTIVVAEYGRRSR